MAKYHPTESETAPMVPPVDPNPHREVLRDFVATLGPVQARFKRGQLLTDFHTIKQLTDSGYGSYLVPVGQAVKTEHPSHVREFVRDLTITIGAQSLRYKRGELIQDAHLIQEIMKSGEGDALVPVGQASGYVRCERCGHVNSPNRPVDERKELMPRAQVPMKSLKRIGT